MKIEVSNRKAAFVELKDFCTFSTRERKDKGDFLEVTEWSNGEGYDIHIMDSNGEKQFHLTWGQMEALFKCVKSMDKSLGKKFYKSANKSISVYRQETIVEEQQKELLKQMIKADEKDGLYDDWDVTLNDGIED